MTAAPAHAAAPAPRPTLGARALRLLKAHPMELILLALYLYLALAAPGFFTANNHLNILRNVTMQGIIAFGMTMVIVSGEIDLSVGSGVALSGCVAAWIVGATDATLGAPLAVALACLGSVALLAGLGWGTGLVRQHFQIPSFITTLALLTVIFGAANLITDGFPLSTFPRWFNWFGSGFLLGVPAPVYVFLLVFAAVWFVMNHTRLGREVYAVGGNMEAARLSGIDVWRVKAAALAITGGLTGVAGLLVASQIMSGTAGAARGWELDVISAVIIGGTSLFGGKGRVWGTLIGVMFLGIIVNGMTLMNVSEYWQYIVRGALIVAAVLLNVLIERLR